MPQLSDQLNSCTNYHSNDDHHLDQVVSNDPITEIDLILNIITLANGYHSHSLFAKGTTY